MIAPTRLHQTGNGSVSTGNGIEFFPVNHANTFVGRASTMASTYREYDVALRNSIENARLMRNDSSIMECLEARQRAVALLKWHIEPEDDRSLEQKQLAEEMTKVMMRTPRFMEMRRVLQEAVWYGKSAVQVMYNTDWIGGYRRFCILSPDRDTPAWLPIHGDKLVFRHDDLTEFDRSKGRYPFQVGIRVGGSFQPGQKVRGKYEVEPVASQFRGTEAVDRGMAYFVDQEDRQKLIIHKHSIEDGAYEDILSAGSIHGVGVRSRIYWDWIQKQEIQAMLLAYIERYHGGIEIYRFPLGNDEAEKAVDSAIRNRQPGRAALKVPIPMGEDAMQYGVEVFESSMAGVQQMMDLLTNFYGHRIKRLILGQILSSESEATGLGSGVADLHLESLLQIIEYDATGLEETITEEPLRRLQHSNFPSSRGIRLRFKIDTREADSDSKLDAVRQAWEMGARVKESDVLDQCGLSAPTASDRVLPAPGGGQGQQPPGLPGMPPAGPPKVQASVPDNVTADPEAEPAKYSYAAQEPDLRSAIERAAAETDQEPTEAQKLAGNYRKGQFHWNGWTIAIETPAGGFRRGKNSIGVEWSHQIPVHYGYIRRTESEADGDALDVFIGPEPESPVVFVVDQVKESGQFDEHKVMIGFRSEQDAAEAYRASYSKGWRGLKSITSMTVNQFRAWVEEGNSGSPIEEQVSRYSQKSFQWNEDEHPRNDQGEFVEKGSEKVPRRQTRDGYVEMRQAKAGGETSDVDGKFYKGGQWMPVHGLSVKSDSDKKPPKMEGGGPPVASENSRPTARSMSPDQIEAERERLRDEQDWQAISSSHLGYVFGLGDRPHNIKHGGGSLTKWVDLIRDGHVTDETLDEVAEVAEQLARSAADKERRIINGKFSGDRDAEYGVKPVTDEEWTFEQERATEGAKDDIEWVSKRADRKILKQHPQIAKARAWVMWMIHYDQSLPTLKKISEVIGQKGGESGQELGESEKYARAHKSLPGQKSLTWDESQHPREYDGRFATVPASHTYGEMPVEFQHNQDGTSTVMRVGKSGERDAISRMHSSQVQTFLNDLGGRVTSNTRSPDESVNRVLNNQAKFLGRGNDGLAFDTGDGNVVKVGSDVAYHWNHGIRPPGEGSARTKKAAELNNRLKAEGVSGLLHQEIIEHDGRTFLKMPKLTIPDKFTQEQLTQVTETIKSLHAKGYAIGDELQPGLDANGNAFIYDTGTLSEAGRYGVEDDEGHLERLWKKSGLEFGGTDPDLIYQNHLEAAMKLIQKNLRFGEKHWQAHKDRLETGWKNVTPDMQEFLGDGHVETLRAIDQNIQEARARKAASVSAVDPK